MLEVELIQVALGGRDRLSRVPTLEEWNNIYAFAERHALIGVLWGGVERLGQVRDERLEVRDDCSSEKPINSQLSTLSLDLMMEWIGQAEHLRTQYKSQRQAVETLTKLWADNEILTIELKGNSIGRYYPCPECRYSSDFDCYLVSFNTTPSPLTSPHIEAWEKGNRIIEKTGIKVDRGFYKNSSFKFQGVLVENHQFCTPVRGNRAMKRFERKLESLLNNATPSSSPLTPNPSALTPNLIYPTAQFNALFLMEHMWAHFFEEALSMKQVVDWCVFRMKCHDEVDWSDYEKTAKDCGFWEFSVAMNHIVDGMLQVRGERLEVRGEMLEVRGERLEVRGERLEVRGEGLEGLSELERRLWDDILKTKGDVEMNNGWKTRWQLTRNYFKNSWKYRYFAPHGALYTLIRTSVAFLFDRTPKV